MCYKKNELDLYHVGYVYDTDGEPKYKHYTVNKICVGNHTHKLQAETNPIREIYTKWKQKQEENMESNIKYYTSLEMVEKIKNGFGRKYDDGNIYFEAALKSGTLAKTLPNRIKYEKGNFYFYSFFDGFKLLPIDVKFGIDEPAFKPIQPKIVHIDFHGVIIPAYEHEISGMNYITCDSDGLIRVYKNYPTLNVSVFSPTAGEYRFLNHIYEYEGDWTQSCTEIKLVEVE